MRTEVKKTLRFPTPFSRFLCNFNEKTYTYATLLFPALAIFPCTFPRFTLTQKGLPCTLSPRHTPHKSARQSSCGAQTISMNAVGIPLQIFRKLRKVLKNRSSRTQAANAAHDDDFPLISPWHDAHSVQHSSLLISTKALVRHRVARSALAYTMS